MGTYILKRLLFFIPALAVISLLAFVISVAAPGDAAEQMMHQSAREGDNFSRNAEAVKQKRHELGLDLPLFYAGMGAWADGKPNAPAFEKYIPALHWHGLENQYHRWLSRLVLHGDFGTSYQTQLPVAREIWARLPWSLVLSLLSVILAYTISIPIGLYAARYRARAFDRVSGVVLFMLHAIPNFLMAMLLMVFFANRQFFNWFPESGIQGISFNNDWPFLVKVQHWAPYLVLPLITYTYSVVSVLGRQMRSGAIEAMQQEYVKTARAKGLSPGRVMWRHVLKNAILPMITIFAGVFPAAVAGSIIVETIFALPGMGQEIYLAILHYDYPVIVAVFTMIGFLTLLGYLISDILYAVADPRISFQKA